MRILKILARRCLSSKRVWEVDFDESEAARMSKRRDTFQSAEPVRRAEEGMGFMVGV